MEKMGCQLVQRGGSRRSFFKFRILEACVSVNSMHDAHMMCRHTVHIIMHKIESAHKLIEHISEPHLCIRQSSLPTLDLEN